MRMIILILKDEINIELTNHTVVLKPGEIFVVPQGIWHRSVARAEAHLAFN